METLQRLHNRGSVSTGPYEIDNSCKFEADNTERMYRAWGGSGGGDDQTWTLSLWVKRTELGTLQHIWGAGVSGNDVLLVSFQTDNTLKFRSTKDGANDCVYVTNRKFRDTSAWYHIVTAVDTTSGTAGDRLRIYINGVEETSFSTETDFAQNDNTLHNANSSYVEIATAIGEADRFCGYIAEVISISGSQLAPTTFGETDSDTGIWIPKQYTGSFPQNSFKLEFQDSSSLGTETSGNGQTFTLQNIAAADQSTDTPTNNFCTWVSDGTLFNSGTNNMTFSEGGTRILTRAGTGWTAVYPTQSFAGGKWYMEVKVNENSATNMYGAMPVKRINSLKYQEYYHGQDVDGSIGLYANNGQIYWGTASSGGTGSALSAGDIVGLAIDMENYKMYFAVNNTYVESGNPAGNSNGRDIEQEPYVFSVAHYTTTTVEDTNFGGYTAMSDTHTNTDDNGYGSFVYAPPSGFLAVCTKNLGENGG